MQCSRSQSGAIRQKSQRNSHYYQPGSHWNSNKPGAETFHFDQLKSQTTIERTATNRNQSHQLTTAGSYQSELLAPRSRPCAQPKSVLRIKGVFLQEKRRAAAKPALDKTRYSVLGTTYCFQQPPRQPLESRPQSPSLQFEPAHSPRWPRYRCKHPHKDAGFHPRASPAR